MQGTVFNKMEDIDHFSMCFSLLLDNSEREAYLLVSMYVSLRYMLPVGRPFLFSQYHVQNMVLCAQQKNIYHKIFGGFLMRQAFELAWTDAALYW